MRTIKELFLLVMLGHVLGDFYFQSSKMAANKKEQLKWVIYHGIEYQLVMLVIVVLLPENGRELLGLSVFLGLAHVGIDVLKFLYINELKKRELSNKKRWTLFFIDQEKIDFYRQEGLLFFIDQIAHMSIIVIGTKFAYGCGVEVISGERVSYWLGVAGVTGVKALSVVVALLVVWRPCSYAIRSLFLYIGQGISAEVNRMSSPIGMLERVIILLLLAVEQYAGITWVVAAKAFMRFGETPDEKARIEYYLLGTLASITLAAMVFIIIL